MPYRRTSHRAGWARRMLAAGQQQRIDEPFTRDQFALGALELGTQKGVIKSRIVNHKRRVADEGEKIVDDSIKRLCPFRNSAERP